MKFDKIMEYQEIDGKLFALEQDAAKSQETNRAYSLKQKIQTAAELVKKLQIEATELQGDGDKCTAQIKEVSKSIEEVEQYIGEIEDETEAEHYIKLLSTLVENLDTLEKEVGRDMQKADEIAHNYCKTFEQGQKANTEFKAAKADYEKMIAVKTDEVKPLKARLAKLSKEIDLEFIELYKSLREAKKLPAFVKFDVSSKQCGRCFMDLPQDALGKLKKPGDWTECPNCRRVLFIGE